MISICKKVKISFFLIFILLISLLSGLFRDVLYFFIIIIIHECGHIITSYIYKWKIEKVEFSICGGYITYDEIIDKPFKEELFIAISGFMFQIILFLVINILFRLNIIDSKTLYIVNKYNISIFIFNMIPIYPLDGSKVLYVFLNKYIPYKKSLKYINYISIAILFMLLIFYLMTGRIEFSYLMLFTFILSKIIKYGKDIPFLFNKLLFERYIYKINTTEYNYINGNKLHLFKRQKINLFKINNHYIKENVILSKKFD